MKATERYLLDELDLATREEFEEHLFDCQECALDVRAGAMFVEQSKVALADAPSQDRRVAATSAKPRWFAWLRPAFAVPAFALLLAVIGYQNLVEVPHLQTAASQPEALPYASLNISTRGPVATQVEIKPEQGFNLFLSIPPDTTYSAYNLELHNPAGSLKWALKIPASSPDDTRSIRVPGSGLGEGTYTLTVTGITTSGQNTNLGNYPVEVKVQK
jgi:hypothetical protein